ncbi:hypothetical protein ACFOVU_10030 [Nocardiopsis sediminis]|uniref:Tox-REase-7 domain-containing protein n=1 Tax=Nocardiopsis sediminis TaxID=1778267 RepID=A0ABV8FMH1_9ACTN
MSDEYVIKPDEIIIPELNACELQTAASALRNDGTGIAQTGNDIKSAWEGLYGIYVAPEADILLAAVNPVATAGDDFKNGVSTVADALDEFAEEAGPIQTRLRELKSEAVAFKAHIDANDDWREDEDKVNEFNDLNDEIFAKLNAYMAAERTCANKITAIFGGTTFVAGEYGQEPNPREGQEVYGYTSVPEGVQTPWATPQEHNAPWWEDVGMGAWDFVSAPFLDAASMVGLYTEEGGWFNGNPIDNAAQYWGDTWEGVKALVGVHGGSNALAAWTEVAHSIVPWREWDDRPGYVITQGVLNIGTTIAGVVLTATGVGAVAGVPILATRISAGMRGLRAVNNVDLPDAPNAPDAPDLPTRRGDLDIDQGPTRPGPDGASPDAELDTALDGLDVPQNQLDGLDDAMDDAARLSELPDTPAQPDAPDTTPSEPGPPDAEAPRDPVDTDTDADAGPDNETTTPDRPADRDGAEPDQTTRDADPDAEASDPIDNPENLPTTREIQEYIQRFREDLDLAEAHPEGIIGELNDRQRELVNAGVPEGRAEMPIGDRPGGGSSPDLSPSARLDTPSGGGPDLPSTDRGGTGTIDAPSSGGGPDLPPGGRGDGPSGLPEDDGGPSDRGGDRPTEPFPAPDGYEWYLRDGRWYIRRENIEDGLPPRWYDEETNRLMPGEERPPPARFNTTNRETAFDQLDGSNPNSSLGGFVKALQKLGLIEDSRYPREIIDTMPNPDGQTHNNVRHRIKDAFRQQLFDHLTDENRIQSTQDFADRIPDNPTPEDVRNTIRAVSQREMLEISNLLDSSDRGRLGEVWYERMYVPGGHTQVTIDPSDLQHRSLGLTGERHIDIVEVTNTRGVAAGRVIEIKNVTTRLGDREESQIRDLLKIPGNEINVPERAEPLPIRNARVVFPDPRGTLRNATFLADFLEENRGSPIEIEIYDSEGQRRTLRANQASIDFLRDRSALKEWLGRDQASPNNNDSAGQ